MPTPSRKSIVDSQFGHSKLYPCPMSNGIWEWRRDKGLRGSVPRSETRPMHTEQPMPNKDEAWATESHRFLRGCRKQSGADGVAARIYEGVNGGRERTVGIVEIH